MPFSVYRFTEFEVFWSSTVSVYRSRTLVSNVERNVERTFAYQIMSKSTCVLVQLQ